MKKVLLRNMWIIALAMVPATMAQSIYVSAAEIPCAFEEVNSAESAEETAEPEETVLTEEMLSSEETILPEGGEEVVPSAEGAIPAEAADPDVFECCVLSRYSPEKGLDMLLDSVKLLDPDKPFRCTICGDGALYGHVGERIKA